MTRDEIAIHVAAFTRRIADLESKRRRLTRAETLELDMLLADQHRLERKWKELTR